MKMIMELCSIQTIPQQSRKASIKYGSILNNNFMKVIPKFSKIVPMYKKYISQMLLIAFKSDIQ